MASISRPGSNSWVTHEMAEMSINCWGQVRAGGGTPEQWQAALDPPFSAPPRSGS